MTTLEDLYYGNISPHERYIKRGTRVDKLVKLICKNEAELNAGLTKQQKETFEKFVAIRDEYQRIWHIQSCVNKGLGNTEHPREKKDNRKQEER